MANLYFNTDQSVFYQDTTLKDILWTYNGSNEVVQIYSAHGQLGPIVPSYSSQFTPEMLVDTLKLGDGYEATTDSGLRGSRLVFPLVFKNLKPEVAAALNRFFLGEGGNSVYLRRPSEWFWWLIPQQLPRGGELRRFRATYSGDVAQFRQTNIAATFTESFDP